MYSIINLNMCMNFDAQIKCGHKCELNGLKPHSQMAAALNQTFELPILNTCAKSIMHIDFQITFLWVATVYLGARHGSPEAMSFHNDYITVIPGTHSFSRHLWHLYSFLGIQREEERWREKRSVQQTHKRHHWNSFWLPIWSVGLLSWNLKESLLKGDSSFYWNYSSLTSCGG